MKHINKTRAIAAAIPLDGGDFFSARPTRAARAIPRRDPDPNEHGGKPKPGEDKPGDKPGAKPGEGGDDDDPKPVDVKKSQEYKTKASEAAAEKKRADEAEAEVKKRADEAEAEVKKLREAGMDDDQKKREAEKDEAVKSAVSAKETELTDHYEGRIAALQTQIIDSTIDGVFASGSLEKKDFEAVIATLDKTQFIKDDGSVDRDKIKNVISPITRAATSRPPRTSGGRVAQNNGFGRYLKQDD